MEKVSLIVGLMRPILRFFGKKSEPLVEGVIKSIHNVVLLLYLSIVSAIVLTAGVFAVVIHSVSQFQNKGFLYFDPINVVGIIVILFCAIASWWLLQEKRLVAALHLTEYFRRNSERGLRRRKTKI